MWLSKNFSLEELCRSEIATRWGIENIPGDTEIENLRKLCVNVLQPIRTKFGPVRVNSGFRNPKVNKKVGSRPTSQHILGYAADIEVSGFSNAIIAEFIRDNLDYTSCILEFHIPGISDSGWVHVSYNESMLSGKCYTICRKNGKLITLDGIVI
jgi:zinc D-Ala-D-Ala carboxypeptidase